VRTRHLPRAVLPGALAIALAVSACGAVNEQSTDTASGPSVTGAAGDTPELSGSVTGAGASTQKVAQDAWTATFTGNQPDVSINYSPIGSGGGTQRFGTGAVAYGGTDVPLQGSQLEQARERCGGTDKLIEMPVYLSPIAISYNLEGIDELNLTPAILAKIFTGKITRWNDPAITRDNTGVDLPDQRITPVHRSDDSGTTGNVTDYLQAAAGEDWPHGETETWPSNLRGESAQGTSGVVKVTSQTPGAITYADASQARDNPSIESAAIEVGDDFVGPTSQAAANILADSQQTDTEGKYVQTFEINRETQASGTYPIVLTSYAMACTEYDSENTAAIVRGYLDHVVSKQGQQLAAKHAGSAPIPASLRDAQQQAIHTISG